jgi:hypothetical protein
MCDAAKDKLRRIGIAHDFVDVSQIDNWSDNGLVDFRVEESFRYGDGAPELPLIRDNADGSWHNYPQAMAHFRRG